MIARILSWARSNSGNSRLAFLAVGFVVVCIVFMIRSSHTSALAGQRKMCRAVELNFDPGVDVHAIESYKMAVADLLKQEKFDDLDCTADELRSSRARFAGGAWQLVTFYQGLSDPWVGHATEADWQAHIERLKRWVKTSPLSITARVGLAESYSDFAWDARGGGTVDTVSETGWGSSTNA
jgi:hypothetical protein